MPALGDAGRAQAIAVAATLRATTSARALLASDYARTMETAAAISARLSLPFAEEPALRERNFGYARGRLYADIGEETMALWRDPHFRIDQGRAGPTCMCASPASSTACALHRRPTN